MKSNGSSESGTTPTLPPAPANSAQPSRPTTFLGAPHIGTDIPAWDDQPAAWRNAFGSDK